MSLYRLKLNLEEFFLNEKKFSYVLVKPEWKYVKDLKEHITNLFSIKNFNLVTEDSVFLPANEDINVINKDDILKVIKTAENIAENHCTSKRHSKTPTPEIQQESVFLAKNEKRKTRKKGKETKLDEKQSTAYVEEIQNIESEYQNSHDKIKNCKNTVTNKTEATTNNLKRKSKDLNDEQIETILLDESIKTDRKRKRKRKCKNEISPKHKSEQIKLQGENGTTSRKIYPTVTALGRKSHIKFTEDGSPVLENDEIYEEVEEKDEGSKVIFQNYLDGLLKPRLIKPTAVGKKNMVKNIDKEKNISCVVISSDNSDDDMNTNKEQTEGVFYNLLKKIKEDKDAISNNDIQLDIVTSAFNFEIQVKENLKPKISTLSDMNGLSDKAESNSFETMDNERGFEAQLMGQNQLPLTVNGNDSNNVSFKLNDIRIIKEEVQKPAEDD